MTWFQRLPGIDEESPKQVRRALTIVGDFMSRRSPRFLSSIQTAVVELRVSLSSYID